MGTAASSGQYYDHYANQGWDSINGSGSDEGYKVTCNVRGQYPNGMTATVSVSPSRRRKYYPASSEALATDYQTREFNGRTFYPSRTTTTTTTRTYESRVPVSQVSVPTLRNPYGRADLVRPTRALITPLQGGDFMVERGQYTGRRVPLRATTTSKRRVRGISPTYNTTRALSIKGNTTYTLRDLSHPGTTGAMHRSNERELWSDAVDTRGCVYERETQPYGIEYPPRTTTLTPTYASSRDVQDRRTYVSDRYHTSPVSYEPVPKHIPGYGGHTPGAKFRYGSTFGQTSVDAARDERLRRSQLGIRC